VNDASQTEDMVALGLQSHIVCTWAWPQTVQLTRSTLPPTPTFMWCHQTTTSPWSTRSLRTLTVEFGLWRTPSGFTPISSVCQLMDHDSAPLTLAHLCI